MEIKDTNKLCDITWHVDLCNGTLRKDTFLLLCPLNQMLGGNSNNLINSLLFFSLKSVWLCNGGGGVTFDANTKKLKPIGATFSVLWCYSIYFSIFVVWMKGILWYYSTTSGLLTFPHPVWSRWMLHNSAFFFFVCFSLPVCYSALVFACPCSTCDGHCYLPLLRTTQKRWDEERMPRLHCRLCVSL